MLSKAKIRKILSTLISLIIALIVLFWSNESDLEDIESIVNSTEDIPNVTDSQVIPSLILSPTLFPTYTDDYGFEYVLVTRVIDGDTIELQDGTKVRYIGIDTPETKHPTKGIECFGKEASHFNKEIVEGKVVKMEKDVNDTDRFGRLLRYVWLEDEMINEKLVKLGYAYASTYPPDIKYQTVFNEAQQIAMQENKGLWAQCEVE